VRQSSGAFRARNTSWSPRQPFGSVCRTILLFYLGLLTSWFSQAADSNPAAAESQFLSHIRQLTFEGKRSGEGYFSLDGKRLIFQSEREPGNPFYQIYILDLESGETHRVSPGTGKTTCGFFRPGSDQVLFASTHLDPEAESKQKAELDFRASGKQRRYSWDYDDQMDIFSARRDGSELRRLTSSLGYDAEASYSPDGQKIVFTSLRDAYPIEKLSAEDRKHLETDPSYFGEIYLMNADGSDQRRLTFSPGYDGGPFFSPDGQRIIWRRFDRSGVNADVFSMRTDGSDVRRVTDFGCMSWAPFFHPSGKYLIFTANKLGFSNFELFLVDRDGEREPVRVTYTDGFDGLPVFSPDGKRLCWTSTRSADGSSQLFLADWNDTAALEALQAAPARTQHTGDVQEKAPFSRAPGGSHPDSAESRSLPAQISSTRLREEVSYLASDALEGRMTGSPGAQLAAEYIADRFRQLGLTPLGSNGSFFQNFEFNSGAIVITNENRLVITREADPPSELFFAPEKDFRPLALTANDEAAGEVVFAGYGLSIPGKPGEGYDSYAGLDVTNRIALVLRYVPENVAPKRRQELNRYAALRYKAMIAREDGAKGILFVTGPNSPNPGQLAALAFDTTLAGSGIVAASITTEVADALLKGSGKTLAALQTDLDSENPHAEPGFLLPKAKAKVKAAVEHLKKTDRNVIACLPRPARRAIRDDLLIGAHFDHLGFGETGAMLRQGEEGKIHPGADDNASGVATVLELAAALSAESQQAPSAFQRGIIFACWSGEELGLIGSSYFAEHPPVPLSNVVACLNFDMVGRLRDNKLILQGTGSSKSWRRHIEKRNETAGFDLALQDDPYLPTDVTSFYPKEVPVLNFFTGSHDDYHRPTDTADKIDCEGMARIAQFAEAIILDLAKTSEPVDYVKSTPANSGGQRENLRVYLGSIPDYAAEVTGVKLSGVRAGSPAEKGGLQAGDIVVEFAGQQVKNIYDYTYALDAAKIGRPVSIQVLRNGQRQTLTVTPEARK
jgi:Tol biopolymer transport system component